MNINDNKVPISVNDIFNKKGEFLINTETGEDIGFCMNAADSGLDIYVDCDVKIGHYQAVTKGNTLGRVYFQEGAMELETDFSQVPPDMLHGVSGLISEMQTKVQSYILYYRNEAEKSKEDDAE